MSADADRLAALEHFVVAMYADAVLSGPNSRAAAGSLASYFNGVAEGAASINEGSAVLELLNRVLETALARQAAANRRPN